MTHKKQSIRELKDTLEQYGFIVYIAKSGEYGIYSDNMGKRVCCFGVTYLMLEFSGNYHASSGCGTGWQLDTNKYPQTKEDFEALLYAPAPHWANPAPKYTTLKEHLERYRSSEYIRELYIVDNNEKFSGSVVGSLTQSIDGCFVDHSGFLYNDEGINLTFTQYKALPEKQGCDLRIINNATFDKLIDTYKKELCESSREKISKQRYYELLECLPPLRYTDKGFLMCEFYYSNITQHVFKEGGKYYTEYVTVNKEGK